MFTSVLIGVDGRQGGRDAIALARQLAAPAATLTLGHVCAPILGRGAVEALPGQRAEARKLLARERGRAAVDARLAVRDPFPVGPGLHDLAERQRGRPPRGRLYAACARWPCPIWRRLSRGAQRSAVRDRDRPSRIRAGTTSDRASGRGV